MDELTPTELLLVLDAPDPHKPRVPFGGRNMGPGELEEYARWWRSLTPRQRIERARKEG